MLDTKKLRDNFGPGEHIAVVGPRCSGVSTIASLLAEFHRDLGRDTLVLTPASADHLRARRPEVTIYDGFIPSPTPAVLRVISTSTII